MCGKVVLVGCAQDAGLPQLGCACRQCDYARGNPDFKDGMVVSLALVDEAEEKVFCTPNMASFLRNNQPWAQLTERGNITITELDVGPTSSSGSSSSNSSSSSNNAKVVRLTSSFSFVPVLVPHRAELSDTVAYLVSVSSEEAAQQTMNVLYCPDTDGWSGWTRSIRSWCEEVDVALLDATFYSKGELKGRDMKEVSHPIVQDTIAELSGVKAEVVLIHLNHTNPLLSADSPERAEAVAGGFTVGGFGMEWALPSKRAADTSA